MKRLVKICTDFLRSFEFDECLMALYIADKAGLRDIHEEVQSFVMDNFLEVTLLEEFNNYPHVNLAVLLSNDELNVESEMQVFRAALRWIEANGNYGLKHAPLLMKQIRFGLMQPEEIVQQVEKVKYIMEIAECHILVLNAFRYFSLRASNKGNLRPPPVRPRKGMNKVRSARRASVAIDNVSIVSIRDKLPSKDVTRPSSRGVPSPFVLASRLAAVGEENAKKNHSSSSKQSISSQPRGDKEGILTIGGLNKEGDIDSPVMKLSLFDPMENKWSTLTSLPHPRNHHAAQVVDGYLYVIGGSGPATKDDSLMSPTSTNYRYDIANDKWDEMSPMKISRIFFQVTVLFGQLYVVGGQDSKGRILSSVERYDPVTNSWRYVASLSSARYSVSLASHRGKLFAVGGYCDDPKTPVVGTVECYDPLSDRWTEKNPLRYGRCHASMVDVGERLYLFGGMMKTGSTDEDCQSLPDVHRYLDDDDTWEYVTDMVEARHESGIAVVGTRIYIIGGISAKEKLLLSSVECFDTMAGHWQHPKPPDLPKPVFGHSCCVMIMDS
ncbi:kelch-like protein 26 [Glandiceps talaboti]